MIVHSRLWLFIAFSSLIISFPVAAQVPEKISAEQIVALRLVREVELSPDGKLALIVTAPYFDTSSDPQDGPRIWIKRTDNQGELQPLDTAVPGDVSPSWSPDGRSIAFLSRRPVPGDTGAQIYIVPTSGGSARSITHVPGGISSFLWSPDSTMIAFLAPEPPASEPPVSKSTAIVIGQPTPPSCLWVTDVATGHTTLAIKLKDDIQEFAWAPDSSRFAIVAGSAVNEDLSLLIADRRSGQTLQTFNLVPGSIPGYLGIRWSSDGKWIAFHNKPSGRMSWSVVPAQGGGAHPLLNDYLGSILQLEFAKNSKYAFVALVSGTHQALMSLNIEDDSLQKIADVSMTSGFSTNGDRFLYTNQTSTTPDDVWTVRPGESPVRLTSLNPQTSSWEMGAVSEVNWTDHSDGLAIHGILIKPVGFRQGTRYPMVVLMHEGDQPWWSGFHAKWWDWGQLLAAQGYVVFMPNYRGVFGQGWRLASRIGDLGMGLAFRDMMDGVDYVIAQGFVDPHRLGIGGWSNGGFMTEWAITHTDRFKAAVALAGFSDLISFYGGSGERYRAVMRNYLHGTPLDVRAAYEANSPLNYARACHTATLLLHGQQDSAVPFIEAYEFHAALKDIGVETKLVIYARDGHFITSRYNQIDVQERVVAWFNQHLK